MLVNMFWAKQIKPDAYDNSFNETHQLKYDKKCMPTNAVITLNMMFARYVTETTTEILTNMHLNIHHIDIPGIMAGNIRC